MTNTRAAVILAAGKGTRMRSKTPKVLHGVGGQSMLAWSADLARGCGADVVVAVCGAHGPQVVDAAQDLGLVTAIQDPPMGTGHAVLAARDALAGHGGVCVVLYADTPLIRPETVEAAFAAAQAHGAPVVVGFEPADADRYGRLVLDGSGGLERIVEANDASPEELAIGLCNSGVVAAPTALMMSLLDDVGNDNAKGEYYLTDIIGLARGRGLVPQVVIADADEVLGVNNRVDLAAAEAAFQQRKRHGAMEEGVTLVAPETVFFAHDTVIAADVVVEPHVVFGPGVRVEGDVVVHSFSHLEGAVVRSGARVGPYARLRPGADVGAGAKVGNFVELKKTQLGEGAKVSHLTYLGDAQVGAHANIGAGTITCNYDGYDKAKTVIGAGAFIGSDTSLVAPVRVGDGAIVGAGSVITGDVPDDALAVARGRQETKRGWAKRFREEKTAQRQDGDGVTDSLEDKG